MERNHIIGFILIFATLILWNVMNAPSKEVLAQRQREKDSIEQIKIIDSTSSSIATIKQNEVTVSAVSDSVQVDSTLATNQLLTSVLENDFLKITFSNRGGTIVAAELKKYTSSYIKTTGENIVLMANPQDKFEFVTQQGAIVTSTNDVFFVPSLSGNTLVYEAELSPGKKISQTYILDKDYGLKYSFKHNETLSSQWKLQWYDVLPKLEKSDLYEQRYSSIYYKKSDENSADYCSCTSDDKDEITDATLDWISHSNQFFNVSLIPENFKFKNAVLETVMTDIKQTDDLKILNSKLELPVGVSDYQMSIYVGPNDFDRLSVYNNGLEEIIPFGSSVFGSINRWVVRPAFNYLSSFFSSKGIVIILLIFIIKMLLYPLLYKMLKSQAKMAALKPELDVIKAKNKDDLQKSQVESMKVYQEYGVSPLAGCMPMLLQMPIWIALYRFFPASIAFRQEPFLWAEDLSSYDAFFKLSFEIPFMGSHISLFTVLWAISTLIYTYYSTKNVDMSANPAMKYVQYFMPLMFLGFFNSYASGLTAYMFFSNLINIIQIIVTKNFIFDDKKIRAELDIQKLKPKKAGGFQAKLADAMKKQQEIANNRQAKK
jgi:YidC/Oxa1 family membrane protein insertase